MWLFTPTSMNTSTWVAREVRSCYNKFSVSSYTPKQRSTTLTINKFISFMSCTLENFHACGLMNPTIWLDLLSKTKSSRIVISSCSITTYRFSEDREAAVSRRSWKLLCRRYNPYIYRSLSCNVLNSQYILPLKHVPEILQLEQRSWCSLWLLTCLVVWGQLYHARLHTQQDFLNVERWQTQ